MRDMYRNDYYFSRTGLLLAFFVFAISSTLILTSNDTIISYIENISFYSGIRLQYKSKDHSHVDPHKDPPTPTPKNTTKHPDPVDPERPPKKPDNPDDHHSNPQNHKNKTDPKKDHHSPYIPNKIVFFSPGAEVSKTEFLYETRLLKPKYKQNLMTIYGTSSFYSNEGVVYKTENRLNFLCRMQNSKHCYTRYIADSVDLLYAICPIYSIDQGSRGLYYQFHNFFLGYIRSIGVKAVTIEGIYPGQNFIATKPDNFPWDIQVHITEKVYLRENLLNVAAKKIKEWEYMAWIDAHQMFLERYWFEDAIWAAEHHDGVQMFQYLEHLDERFNQTISWFNLGSTQYAYTVADPPWGWPEMSKGVWNGNAFIIRRELYENIGYILDTCIAGCCDCAYNIACFRKWYDWYLQSFPNYKVQLIPWLEMAWTHFKKKPKALRGRMVHFYHPILFDWGVYLKKVSEMEYSLQDELYRDDEFILHIKDGSRLAAMFPR